MPLKTNNDRIQPRAKKCKEIIGGDYGNIFPRTENIFVLTTTFVFNR